MKKTEFKAIEDTCSVCPVVFDAQKCVGCNMCVNVCQVDVLIPGSDTKTPVVLYPGECYYCGSCVMACKNQAIRLRHPLMNMTKFTEVKNAEKQL